MSGEEHISCPSTDHSNLSGIESTDGRREEDGEMKRDGQMEDSIRKRDTVMVDRETKEDREMDEMDSSELILSHQEAMSKVEAAIDEIVSTDPLLYDLPPEVTLEEVNSFIALEHGQAMLVNVRRADGQVLSIVVVQNGMVLDLKHAINRHMTLKLARSKGKKHISWRYIWRRYCLYFEGQKLSEDKKQLKEYGIRNKDEVTFIKRLKER